MKQTVHVISEYIRLLAGQGLYVSDSINDENTPITGLTYDSREVSEGTLFIVKGAAFKDEYLLQSMRSGAAAYVSEKNYGLINGIVVSDIRKAMAFLSKLFYGDPSSELRTVGITGTKGKSTTACFLRAIFDKNAELHGERGCGFISSVEIFDGKEKFVPHQTTPEAPEIWKRLRNGVGSGLSDFVIEVSSQALKYARVAELTFDIACFTNIDIDHISPIEHSDFNDYFSSKLMIFDQCGIACVNADDSRSGEMIDYIGGRVPVITFGTKDECTVRCENIRKDSGLTHFDVLTPDWKSSVALSMPGLFNVSNALAAIAVSYAAGIGAETIRAALLGATAPGRMQIYRTGDKRVTVLVDYAHNKLSFEAVYASIRAEYPGASVISIFGCTGGKSQNRRKDVGITAGNNSEHVIITEKDSADEPFGTIAGEIADHVRTTGCAWDIIEDRVQALDRAFELKTQNENRIILFAGRGEERGQKRGKVNVDYPSDVEIALERIRRYDMEAAQIPV